jgi:hypothetical protein
VRWDAEDSTSSKHYSSVMVTVKISTEFESTPFHVIKILNKSFNALKDKDIFFVDPKIFVVAYCVLSHTHAAFS